MKKVNRAAMLFAATCVVCPQLAFPAGSVARDGSLGRGTVGFVANNNTFYIHQRNGQTVGTNLFQSLSTLNLDSGETADFTGQSGISNVITRVTGGTSTINGTLECDIPGANFYLINSSGIVFGPGAALDVKGSFAVTTADVVHLADGGKFPASLAKAPLLTVAAPSAFGFLSPHPKGVVVNGTNIQTNTAQSLTVVSGNVSVINGGELATSSRAGSATATVVSVASLGTVIVSNPLNTQAFSSMGNVFVGEGGVLGSDDRNGVNSGPVNVAGGNVIVTGSNSAYLGSLSGTGNADSVHVRATGILSVIGSAELGSDSSLNGGVDSGPVTVRAENMTVTSSLGSFAGGGNAGPVGIKSASTIEISRGGEIGSDSSYSGMGVNAGNVTLAAQSVRINAGSTGIAEIASISGSGGCGVINLLTDELTIKNGGRIDGDTSGSGKAATINVTVDVLAALDGSGSPVFTGIGAACLTGSTGNGGHITVDAQTLSLMGGAKISAATRSSGHGGSCFIDVTGLLSLDGSGQSTMQTTGITAESKPESTAVGTYVAAPGDAGSVTVIAGAVSITNSADITARTVGIGSAGDVRLTASDITLSNAAQISAASVSSGPAGDVVVNAVSLSIDDGAQITAKTGGTGNGGNCLIDVTGNATVDGLSSFPTVQLTGISANSVDPTGGLGGNVSLTVPSLSLSNEAEITASNLGTGTAGKISFVVQNLNLQNGAITSDSNGTGGNIIFSSDGILFIRDSRISANAGAVGKSIFVDPGLVILDNSVIVGLDDKPINGNSKGTPVNVQIIGDLLRQDSTILTDTSQTFPGYDISAALISLPAKPLDNSVQLVPSCEQMLSDDITSSFIQSGHGGLPIEPGGWIPVLVPSDEGK